MSSQREIEGTETLPLESAAGVQPAQQDLGTAETLPLKDALLARSSHLGAGGVETLPLEGPIRALASQPAMTLPLGGAGEPLTPAAAPPVTTWDRYELLDLLGKGGMGSVYRARDRRLDRTLAIKFLLGADPNLTVRFLREARAQARIDHPNICRVYEVGEVSGRAYIALQLINGEPLHKAAARMSLDEKVAVMRDVAVAVQEAHRLGIVHRDLKPANIMVERTDDGRWFPVVMDFGLAREATVEAGLTESGTVLGTPAYMSPEQAIGDVHAIDRRSDVYSLGATLYELLTGHPPFASTSLAQMLSHVIHDDPPAPRGRVSSLHVDLETIALKCLAKEPTQRYPSARALADDLTRYLDGEPILGRRLSRWQRLRLYARRHRALMVLGAWSLAVIIALGTFGIRTWIISRTERARTNERTRLTQRLTSEETQRLTSEAKDIELHLQLAYQWPLHNTHTDRERLRAQMRAIAATQHDLGELGDGIIHEALGYGHLALHEWREAADELGLAETADRHSPALHAARGRALGELYRRALESALAETPLDDASLDYKARLTQQQQELEQRYLAPAVAYLELSRGSGENAELLEARIALYRRDFTVAGQRARAIIEHAPESAEARQLAADAAYGAAIEAFGHGDYDAARPGLERAAALYAEASEIARSDASLYQVAAETWLQRAEVEFRERDDGLESLHHALAAIDLALRADPDDASSYITKANVLLATYRLLPAADVQNEHLLDLSEQAAGRAGELDPNDANAWTSLGLAYIYRGRDEFEHGGQSERWWKDALEEFGKALAIQPNNVQAHNGLGIAHRWLGTRLAKLGHDPMPEFQEALRSYERATTLDPQFLKAWTNQIDLYVVIAEDQLAAGIDPRSTVDRALRAGERCLKIDPNFYAVLDNLTQTQLVIATYLIEAGGDPTAALTSAHDYIDRTEKAEPETQKVWFRRLAVADLEATFGVSHGFDPTRSVATGRAALKEALRLGPSSAYYDVKAAHLDLALAKWMAHTAQEPRLLVKALADAENAIAHDGQSAMAQLTAAEVCLQMAKAQRSSSIINRGIDHVTKALSLDPRLHKAPAVRDELSRLSAL